MADKSESPYKIKSEIIIVLNLPLTTNYINVKGRFYIV